MSLLTPRFSILLFTLIYCTCGRAQTPGQVRLDSANHAVYGVLSFPGGDHPGGNVLALHPRDSSFITGDFFLDGDFRLSGLTEEEVLLRFTSLEFADVYRHVDFSGVEEMDLGVVEVTDAGVALETVVVKGRRQLITQRADGTVNVRVAGTALAASNTTAEILSRAPEVQIDENGVISILGRGEANVYLDGQPITPRQLALIAAGTIEEIAIIRNPSSRYDAGGGAVVEITTRQGAAEGYRLTLQQNTSDSDFGDWQTNSSVNAALNRGRFAATANYALQLGNHRHVKFTTRDRTDPAVFLSSAVTTDWQYDYRPYHYYGAGVQYKTVGGSRFSLGYAGFREENKGSISNTNRLIDAAEMLDFASEIQADERAGNHTVSLNYNRSLDSLGSRLFVAGQYAVFTTDADNPIGETGRSDGGTVSRRWLRNVQDSDIRATSLQLDYTKAFPGGAQLDAGLRFGNVYNDADLAFFVSTDNKIFRPESRLSSRYRYDETVTAAYLDLSQSISDRVHYRLGVRAERTDYDLSLTEDGTDRLTDDYLNLFPHAALTWQAADGRSLNVAYTARIERPPYQDLNPNPIYQDPYTSIQGNPKLTPEKTHGIELTGRSGPLTAKLGYRYTLDPLAGAALPGDGPRSYVLKRLNFSEGHEWYASVSHTLSLPWWTSTNTATLTRRQLYADLLAFAPVAPRPMPYFFTDNRFELGGLFGLEVLYTYSGELREGTFTRYAYSNLTLALDGALLDDALTIRLLASDVLHKVRASGDYRQGETDIYFDNRWRSAYLRLSVSWNFGRLRAAGYQNQDTGGAERSRIR